MSKSKEELQAELEKLRTMRKEILEGEVGNPCEVYSRIVGYYRATSAYNPGMKQRFDDQKYYNVK